MEARDYYREAIVYVEDLVDARRKERNDLLMPLYSNLAQVYLRLEEPALAEDVCILEILSQRRPGASLKAAVWDSFVVLSTSPCHGGNPGFVLKVICEGESL
eukprot:g11478.t1